MEKEKEKEIWKPSGKTLLKLVYRIAASVSAGSLSEMQNLRPYPDLLHQNLHCDKIPGEFCTHYSLRMI